MDVGYLNKRRDVISVQRAHQSKSKCEGVNVSNRGNKNKLGCCGVKFAVWL